MLFSHQHPPQRRVPLPHYKTRRSKFAFHGVAQALRPILILKSSSLDREPVFRQRHGWEREDVYANLRDARPDHLNHKRGGVGKIDDSPGDEGTTVDDTNGHRFSVGEIRDAHESSEGKRAVRGGQFLHVVNLAIRGGASVIWMTVPTRDARFARGN